MFWWDSPMKETNLTRIRCICCLIEEMSKSFLFPVTDLLNDSRLIRHRRRASVGERESWPMRDKYWEYWPMRRRGDRRDHDQPPGISPGSLRLRLCQASRALCVTEVNKLQLLNNLFNCYNTDRHIRTFNIIFTKISLYLLSIYCVSPFSVWKNKWNDRLLRFKLFRLIMIS